MIYLKGNKETVSLVIKGKAISYLYNGSQLLWEAIRSCFGSGQWISKKPWLYKEGWRNGKRKI